jgi:hypothetical protein
MGDGPDNPSPSPIPHPPADRLSSDAVIIHHEGQKQEQALGPPPLNFRAAAYADARDMVYGERFARGWAVLRAACCGRAGNRGASGCSATAAAACPAHRHLPAVLREL